MNNKQELKEILLNIKNIAIVGASSNPNKESYIVMDALKNLGYEIFPVNPNYSGNMILGRKCYPNLKSIKEKIDMVDLFRSEEFLYDLTKEAIEIDADVLWMQEGLIHEQAANLGRDAGMMVVMNECPKKILEQPNWTNKH